MHTEKQAEDAGYDAGKNGPNTANCHFAFFAKPELTRAWERGNERGLNDRLDGLKPDVVRLVLAAREAAFGGHIQDEEVRRELDQASEAFASRVPWEDEPVEPVDAPASA